MAMDGVSVGGMGLGGGAAKGMFWSRMCRSSGGTDDSHESWVQDMRVPGELMDGGQKQKRELAEAAAAYCQAIFRGQRDRRSRGSALAR